MTFLDLLVVVFVGVSAVSLLAVCLMFLVRKPLIQRICFYIVVALGVYCGWVGMRIGSFHFPMQTGIGAVAGMMSIAALVLERMHKGDEKKFFAARIFSAAALIIGILNAFIF